MKKKLSKETEAEFNCATETHEYGGTVILPFGVVLRVMSIWKLIPFQLFLFFLFKKQLSH
jgi:hypothetical protein